MYVGHEHIYCMPTAHCPLPTALAQCGGKDRDAQLCPVTSLRFKFLLQLLANTGRLGYEKEFICTVRAKFHCNYFNIQYQNGRYCTTKRYILILSGLETVYINSPSDSNCYFSCCGEKIVHFLLLLLVVGVGVLRSDYFWWLYME